MADHQATSGRVLTLPCVVCAKAFTYVTKSTGRYARLCSHECKTIRARRNRRAKRIVQCKTCALLFHPRQMSQASRLSGYGRYCSRACRPQSQKIDPAELAIHERQHAQRSRARCAGATEIHWIDDRAIFERDGWRCGICHSAVNPSLKAPHRYSVCIDHIVPLARGGQHVSNNIQCAHWICNSRKGDRLPSGLRASAKRDGRTHFAPAAQIEP